MHQLCELFKRNAAIAILVHLSKNSLHKSIIHLSVDPLKQLLNLIGVNEARAIPVKHSKRTCQLLCPQERRVVRCSNYELCVLNVARLISVHSHKQRINLLVHNIVAVVLAVACPDLVF